MQGMNMPDYHKMTDEAVISVIREGDTEAVDFILEKYKNLVRQKARKLFLIGGDQDDLIQEGMIGLYKAIRDYRMDKESSFRTFADLCVSRQIYDAIKSSNRQKNIPLNTYISLNTPIYGKNSEKEEEGFLADRLFANNKSNPEKLVIDKENTSVLEYELERRLSNFELQVLEQYLSGCQYTEIAQTLQKNPKSIDNALQRIRTKVSTLIKDLGEN